MKIINTRNTYEIYDDTLQTFDKLPAQIYTVCFSKMQGFFLEKYNDIEINEKVYGVHTDKVNKVFKSFKLFDRNLGVILSGNKGIGKSLFAKMLAITSVKNNIPVVIVNDYIPGIASYLQSIEQEIMVLFDEFDKTFTSEKDEDGKTPQASMLTLFDGLSTGKKMFVITCNNVNKLNDYLVNRPGRFHYHFRFEYPNSDEISEYLKDKLNPSYYSAINDVIAFANKVDLNYDCLRAIAFELNTGIAFKEAIKDLNILNLEEETYKIILHYSNGYVAEYYYDHFTLDLFSEKSYNCCVVDMTTRNGIGTVHFNTNDCVFDMHIGKYIIPAEHLSITYDDDYNENDETYKLIQTLKNVPISHLELKRNVKYKNLHYAI